MEARSATREVTVASLHPGVTLENAGDLRLACDVRRPYRGDAAADRLELTTLRDLQARTKAAHELYDCAQGHWLCRKGVGFRYRRGFCVVRFGAQRGRSSFVE
jgi:hypothetical protein